jgi:hypothetical protein
MTKQNTSAPGAVRLSPRALIPTSQPDACQAQPNQTEQSTGLPIQSGGASVSRESSNEYDRRRRHRSHREARGRC